MININFLAGQNKSKRKQKQQDKRWFKISAISLIVVVIVLIALLAAKLLINLQIKNKAEEIVELKQTILQQEQVELRYLIFVNKLEVVSEIYAQRSDKQAAMEYFAQLFADQASITGMTYNEDNGGLTLQLNHRNVFLLDESMALLNSAAVQDNYKNVEKKSLTREDQGNYTLNLLIQLKTIQELEV